MRRLRDDLYVIETGLYAERRGEQWFVTDEEEAVQAGPFASLEDLAASRVEADLDALDPDAVEVMKPGDPGFVTFPLAVEPIPQIPELMTLRQAAKYLPVTSQALYLRRRSGSLPEPAEVHQSHSPSGKPVELYRFSELSALFEGKTLHQRVTEGNRRSWSRLTPEQRAERIAKIQKGRAR